MAFTKLVKNIIKQRVMNNLVQVFLNGMHIPGIGSLKTCGTEIKNKSPLDLSQSPVDHMKPVNNPFNFGNVYYPQETSNLGDGHYIIFDIIENNKTNLKRWWTGKPYPKSLGRVGEGKLNSKKEFLN